MPLLLHGSCRCGSVKFKCESQAPQPYQLCYCSICRKTAGGGGYAINLGAIAGSLQVDAAPDRIGVFRADIRNDEGHCETSTAERSYCVHCASSVALLAGMAGPASPVRLGHRQRSADPEIPCAPDAQVQGELGRAVDRGGRCLVRSLPRGVARAMASAKRSVGRLGSGAQRPQGQNARPAWPNDACAAYSRVSLS
jgi:hypothetical protein